MAFFVGKEVRRMKKLVLFLAVLIFFTFAARGYSQDKVYKLEEVVVTATRTEKEPDKAPGSVTVIKADEIKKLKIDAIDEAIKWETGLYARRTKGLAYNMPSINMRGLPKQDRTLVLLDGMPINSGSWGGVDFNELSIEDVERIEVIRGPMSALYGGNSMGGVINIITKTPKRFYANASYGYGTDNTYRYIVSVGDRFWDRLSLDVGHEREETNGYPTSLVTSKIKSGAATLKGGWLTYSSSGTPKWVIGDRGDNTAKRWNVHAKAVYDITDTGRLTLSFQKGLHRYDYDRPHTYLKDQNGRLTYSGYVDVGGGKRAKAAPKYYVYYGGEGEAEYYYTTLIYEDIFGPFHFNGKAGYQRWNSWYDTAKPRNSNQGFDDAPGELSDSNTYSWFADLQATVKLLKTHTLTFGYYFRYDDYDGDDFKLSYYRDEDSRTQKTLEVEGKDRFISFYGQDEWNILKKLTLYTGIRIDWWKAYDGYSSKAGDFDEKEDYCISPKFSAVYSPLKDTIIKASIGRAFRAPNIGELYKTWTWGSRTYHSNPGLDPETLWNYEVDIIQYLFSRKVKITGTYFHTDIDDLIYSYYQGRDKYKDNVADAEIDGYELGITIRPIKWLKFWGNYTYHDSEITSCDKRPELEGKAFAEVPISMANVGADLSYRWIKASIAAQYIGNIYKSELNDDVPDVYGGYTRRYWICDARLSVSPIDKLEVSASIRNMFDKEYYEYEVGNGRTYFVEVRYKWQ